MNNIELKKNERIIELAVDKNITNEYAQKNCFIAELLRRALNKYLDFDDIKVDSSNSIYNLPIVNEEINIIDFQINSLSVHVIPTVDKAKNNNVYIPKVYKQFNLKPDIILFANFSKSLAKTELLGFITEVDYRNLTISKEYLQNSDDLVKTLKTLKPNHSKVSDNINDAMQELMLGYIEDDLTAEGKRFFLKYILSDIEMRKNYKMFYDMNKKFISIAQNSNIKVENSSHKNKTTTSDFYQIEENQQNEIAVTTGALLGKAIAKYKEEHNIAEEEIISEILEDTDNNNQQESEQNNSDTEETTLEKDNVIEDSIIQESEISEITQDISPLEETEQIEQESYDNNVEMIAQETLSLNDIEESLDDDFLDEVLNSDVAPENPDEVSGATDINQESEQMSSEIQESITNDTEEVILDDTQEETLPELPEDIIDESNENIEIESSEMQITDEKEENSHDDENSDVFDFLSELSDDNDITQENDSTQEEAVDNTIENNTNETQTDIANEIIQANDNIEDLTIENVEDENSYDDSISDNDVLDIALQAQEEENLATEQDSNTNVNFNEVFKNSIGEPKTTPAKKPNSQMLLGVLIFLILSIGGVTVFKDKIMNKISSEKSNMADEELIPPPPALGDAQNQGNIPKPIELEPTAVAPAPTNNGVPVPTAPSNNDSASIPSATKAPSLPTIPTTTVEPPKAKHLNDALATALTKDFNGVRISKVSWEISETLATNPDVKQYLTLAGKAIKSNLSQDLMSATEPSFKDNVVVKIVYNKSGAVSHVSIDTSSGSKQIDDIVLKSVKGVLNYLTMPALKLNKNEYTAKVHIRL